MTKDIIPTINISSIINQNFSSNKSIKTISKIKKACINIGFFQVIGHGINKKNNLVYSINFDFIITNFIVKILKLYN